MEYKAKDFIGVATILEEMGVIDKELRDTLWADGDKIVMEMSEKQGKLSLSCSRREIRIGHFYVSNIFSRIYEKGRKMNIKLPVTRKGVMFCGS